MHWTSQYLLFLAASALLILTPGPGVLYIVTRSLSQGRAAGLTSVLGVGTGNSIHVIFAAIGLSALLASSAALFTTMKFIGAAYLLYLGLKKFLSAPADVAVPGMPTQSLRAVFVQGVAVGTLNPKTALFFLAFLPQFVVSGAGPAWLQLIALGGTFVVMAVVSDGAYALLSGALAPWLRERSMLRHERYVSGTVYCALGAMTALSVPVKTS